MPRMTLFAWSLFVAGFACAEEPPPILAKTVTLTRTATAAEIATAIRDQTGITVDVSGVDPTKKVEFHADKTPFWTTLDKLADDTGCRLAVSRGGREIALVPRLPDVGKPPSA